MNTEEVKSDILVLEELSSDISNHFIKEFNTHLIGKVFYSRFTPILKVMYVRDFVVGEFIPRISQLLEVYITKGGLVIYSYLEDQEYMISKDEFLLSNESLLELVLNQVNKLNQEEYQYENISIASGLRNSNTDIFIQAVLGSVEKLFNEDYLNVITDITVYQYTGLQKLSFRVKFNYLDDKFLLVIDADSYDDEGLVVYRFSVSDLVSKKELFSMQSEVVTEDSSLFVEGDLPYLIDKLIPELDSIINWQAPVCTTTKDVVKSNAVESEAEVQSCEAVEVSPVVEVISESVNVVDDIELVSKEIVVDEDKDINKVNICDEFMIFESARPRSRKLNKNKFYNSYLQKASIFLVIISLCMTINLSLINKEIDGNIENNKGDIADIGKDHGDELVGDDIVKEDPDQKSENEVPDKDDDKTKDDVVINENEELKIIKDNIKKYKNYKDNEYYIMASKGVYIYEESKLVGLLDIEDEGYAPIYITEKGYSILFIQNGQDDESNLLTSAESRSLESAVALTEKNGKIIKFELLDSVIELQEQEGE